jgi:hypothetical protein
MSNVITRRGGTKHSGLPLITLPTCKLHWSKLRQTWHDSFYTSLSRANNELQDVCGLVKCSNEPVMKMSLYNASFHHHHDACVHQPRIFKVEFVCSCVPRPVAFHRVIEYTSASDEGHIGNKQISCSVQEHHNWRSNLENNVAVNIHNAKVDFKYVD